MRAIVARAAVIAAATGGLAASFLMPAGLKGAMGRPEEVLRTSADG
jgi:hypothetical protein